MVRVPVGGAGFGGVGVEGRFGGAQGGSGLVEGLGSTGLAARLASLMGWRNVKMATLGEEKC